MGKSYSTYSDPYIGESTEDSRESIWRECDQLELEVLRVIVTKMTEYWPSKRPSAAKVLELMERLLSGHLEPDSMAIQKMLEGDCENKSSSFFTSVKLVFERNWQFLWSDIKI